MSEPTRPDGDGRREREDGRRRVAAGHRDQLRALQLVFVQLGQDRTRLAPAAAAPGAPAGTTLGYCVASLSRKSALMSITRAPPSSHAAAFAAPTLWGRQLKTTSAFDASTSGRNSPVEVEKRESRGQRLARKRSRAQLLDIDVRVPGEQVHDGHAGVAVRPRHGRANAPGHRTHKYTGLYFVEEAGLRACVARGPATAAPSAGRRRGRSRAAPRPPPSCCRRWRLSPRGRARGRWNQARPVSRVLVPRLLVHVGEHQHQAGLGVLHDCRHQALREIGCHSLTSRPRPPAPLHARRSTSRRSERSTPPGPPRHRRPSAPRTCGGAGRRRRTRSPAARTAALTAFEQLEVVAVVRAVAVHRREQDLPRPELRRPPPPTRPRRGRRRRRPPWLNTSQPAAPSRLRASIASTTHCDPNTSAHRVISVRVGKRRGVDATPCRRRA